MEEYDADWRQVECRQPRGEDLTEILQLRGRAPTALQQQVLDTVYDTVTVSLFDRMMVDSMVKVNIKIL